MITSGFCPRVRAACAARTRLFGLSNMANGALRAPLLQLRCSPPPQKKTISGNKMLPFRPKLAPPGRISFHWAKLHPTELHCTLLSYTAPL